MKRFDGSFGGHLRSSVREVLKRCPEIAAETPWALVTTIDSLDDLTYWKAPESLRDIVEHVGKAVRLPAAVLAEAARSGLFSGFDEVWLAKTFPTVTPPTNVFIVSPYDIEADGLRPEIVAWLKSGPFEAGLGDGIGLNVVTRSEAISKMIEVACAGGRHGDSEDPVDSVEPHRP
jgi:hypothetical protein